MLKTCTSSNQVTAECLCSLLLLEGSTPRQVFNEYLLARTMLIYLLARTHAIQQLCQQDQAAVSIKTQVCDLAQMIVTTVHQIYTIFYSGHSNGPDTGQQAGDGQGSDTKGQVPCNQLMLTLSKVTDMGEAGAIITEAQMSVSMRHLPSNVTEFRPSLRHHATPISTENINNNCQQWINTCISDVNAGLNKLLTFITTVRGLALIRDQVWLLLRQDDRLQTWDLVCEQVLSRRLALWQEFFQQLFTDRTKTLLQEQFVTALENSKQHVAKVLSDLAESTDSSTLAERNLAAHIWMESTHDIPANRAWVVAGSNKNISQGGSLMMKAYAYTPAAQRLCQSLDSKLHVLLEDAGHYIVVSDTPEEGSTGGGRTMSEGADLPVFAVEPFDKFADRDTIVSFIQTASSDCVHRLLDHLSDQLDRSKEQLLDTSTDLHSCATVIHRALLLARLTAALCQLSPELQCCVGGSVLDNLDNSRSTRRSVQGLTGGLSKTQDNPQWVQLKTHLQQFSQKVFSLWTTHICCRLVSQFASSLLDPSPKVILQGSMRWDDIEIEEETEEGTSMKSTIHVPMHASSHLHSLLYELCENINRVGAHAIDRVTLGDMVTAVSDGIVTTYETFLDDSQKASVNSDDSRHKQLTLTQNRALQMLFDLKFVMKIFPRKEEGQLGSKYQQQMERLEERLEKHIDPFDLDVFTPYMQQHIVFQTQRCNYDRPGYRPRGVTLQYDRPGYRPRSVTLQYDRPGYWPRGVTLQYDRPGYRPHGVTLQYDRPGYRSRGVTLQYDRPGYRPHGVTLQYDRPGYRPRGVTLQYNRPGYRPRGVTLQYDRPGELSDRAGGKTDTDSGSIFECYSDVSDNECDGVNAEDDLRTVLSMLDDVLKHIYYDRMVWYWHRNKS
ncbi:Conserved oligomeric Golgi complex subunit 1 [Lamellibrachia satsuma]|nr:Conserved oligomeric Golgi complex subunit 1 [Lamellibrachia satsuma]